MKQRRLPSFIAEQTQYSLRFTCEYCTYFDVKLERCMHGYPNADHRTARYEADAQTQQSTDSDDASLVFCKEFELM